MPLLSPNVKEHKRLSHHSLMKFNGLPSKAVKIRMSAFYNLAQFYRSSRYSWKHGPETLVKMKLTVLWYLNNIKVLLTKESTLCMQINPLSWESMTIMLTVNELLNNNHRRMRYSELCKCIKLMWEDQYKRMRAPFHKQHHYEISSYGY